MEKHHNITDILAQKHKAERPASEGVIYKT